MGSTSDTIGCQPGYIREPSGYTQTDRTSKYISSLRLKKITF